MCSITICIQCRYLIISCAKVNIGLSAVIIAVLYAQYEANAYMTTCKIESNAHVSRMTTWILFMHTELQILPFLSNGIPTATSDFK